MCFTPLKSGSIKSYNIAIDNIYGIYNAETTYGALNGVICLLNIDYDKKINIFLHEHTIDEKVQRYFQSFKHTRVQFTPVLLAYDTSNDIPDLVDIAKALTYSCAKKYCFSYKEFNITLSNEQCKIVFDYINAIPELYLIDGHHRYEAARNLAKKNGSHTLVVMLVAKKRLLLDSFHRVVRLYPKHLKRNIRTKIKSTFYVESTISPYIPKDSTTFGMYFDNTWYKLSPKKNTTCKICNADNLATHLLSPILDLSEKKYGKIEYLNSYQLSLLENADPDSIIFSLSPISIDEYTDRTKNNILFLPHSTCFLPKPDNNCFIYNHNDGLVGV